MRKPIVKANTYRDKNGQLYCDVIFYPETPSIDVVVEARDEIIKKLKDETGQVPKIKLYGHKELKLTDDEIDEVVEALDEVFDFDDEFSFADVKKRFVEKMKESKKDGVRLGLMGLSTAFVAIAETHGLELLLLMTQDADDKVSEAYKKALKNVTKQNEIELFANTAVNTAFNEVDFETGKNLSELVQTFLDAVSLKKGEVINV